MDDTLAEDFDPNKADVYVQHLADMNEVQDVVASEDIFNEFGVLLVPKGARIKKSVADKLMGHKVEKPVHQVVSLSGCLNGNRLFDCFHEMSEANQDIKTINTVHNYENKLKHLCTRSELPLALMQKVTVMKEKLPRIFNRTIFSTWLATLIASQQGKELDFIYDTFLAGLFHDIGLLHIAEELANKEKDVTENEWKFLRTHIRIGQKIVETFNMVSDQVIRAISEHHERCDGTGYPNNRSAKGLGTMGQAIAIAETIYALRFEKFQGTKKNLSDVMPYMQVNQHTYFFENFRSFHKILASAGLKRNCSLHAKDFAMEVAEIKVRNNLLGTLHTQMRLLFQYLLHQSLNKAGINVAASIKNSLDTIARSGVIGDELGQWLDQVENENFDDVAIELEDLTAMQYEVLFNLRRSFRYFSAFSKAKIKPSHYLNDLLDKLSTEISEVLNGAWTTVGG